MHAGCDPIAPGPAAGVKLRHCATFLLGITIASSPNMRRKAAASVLVVEDEPDIRETLRDILEMEGYRVRCAANGKEALDVLAEMKPKLILLDLMMPVMSGYELLQRLRESDDLAKIPVTVVSAVGDRATVRNASILKKPFDLDVLLHLVDQQCAAHP
jgi:two-component system, chemotaxis family, chemotaxis protein CheY